MKASRLRKVAEKHNRKEYRKHIISLYRDLKKAIKKSSKNGLTKFYTGTLIFDKGDRYSDGYRISLAVRLFSFKHRDFYVEKSLVRKNSNSEDIFYTIKWGENDN